MCNKKVYKIIKAYPNSPSVGKTITWSEYDEQYIDEYCVYYSEKELQNTEFFELQKDWEILEIRTNVKYTLQSDGKYLAEGFGYKYSLEEVQKNDLFTITKVKDLISGEVYSIGDKVVNPAGHSFVITKFYLDCNGEHMLCNGNNTGAGHVGISKIKKYVEPKVIYITEDGHKIYKPFVDKVTFVFKELTNNTYNFRQGYMTFDSKSPDDKYFYNHEKALEFIAKKNEEKLLDSKCLSINEVKQILDRNHIFFDSFADRVKLESKLKELVKSKQ